VRGWIFTGKEIGLALRNRKWVWGIE